MLKRFLFLFVGTNTIFVAMIINGGQFVEYSFFLIIIIQLFYYLFFFQRLSFYKPKIKRTSQTHPVSVVMCARDEATNLVKNLPGLLAQVYPTTHEIIAVNDNSVDESKYVLASFYKKFKQLKILELTQEAKLITGKKFPLSMGIKSAKYEILLLTDADCMPASENWISKMQEAYGEKTEIVLGYGPLNKRKGFLNKLIRWETFHTALQYLSYALAGYAYMGVGRNLSYKRAVFFRLKGFSAHNSIASGDDDLFINMASTRENTEIEIDKDAFTYSDAPDSWSQWKKQKERHYSTGKFYKPLYKFLLGLYSLSHFLVYPLLITGLFYHERIAILIGFSIRLIVQSIVFYRAMDKLNERDLFPYFIFLDFWMFFYYLLFSVSLFKRPSKSWK